MCGKCSALFTYLHTHTHAYVCSFLVVPFFLQPLALQSTYTHPHLGTRTTGAAGAGAAIKCISIASSHTIFVFVFTSMHSLTLFVSALNLVNYCCSSVPIREEQFLNTIFVDSSLCLQFSHTHTHTCIQLSLLAYMCVCVLVRESKVLCVCVCVCHL